ncbi:MAG: type I 3-dehydroquinate dehydratase, partial [Nitrososphaerales archaeon]
IRSRSEGGKSKMSERKRISLISKGLLSLNPRFIDVEILTLIKHPQILSDIEITKTKLIASFHDLEGKKTPPSLNEILSRAPIKSRSLYAIKIVKQAKRISDNQKVLSLYSHKILKGERAPKLVAFCAGEKGADSRIRCLFLGSPFSYCSLPGEPTAAGQLDIQNMREAIAKRFPGSLG